MDDRSEGSGVKNTRMIELIRHGATSLNNDDISVDRIRGWKDVPLSADGRKEAYVIAEKMAHRKPDVIVTSDLKRAYGTAEIIARELSMKVALSTRDFRPWNVGTWSGVVTSKAIPILIEYAEHKPDKPLPAGESFDSFRLRFLTGLSNVLAKYPGRIALVTHHRGERLLKAWTAAGCATDGAVAIKEFTKKGNHTGLVEMIEIPQDRLASAVKALSGESKPKRGLAAVLAYP
jgi:broad specificity phosphatase PhoE